MKYLTAILLLVVSMTSNAAGVYTQPAVKITYTEQGVLYGVTTMIRTQVTAFGNTELLYVNVKNNTAVAKNFSIQITDPLGAISTVFVPDGGCDALVSPYGTCTVMVSFTPDHASPDGVTQVVDNTFTLLWNGVAYRNYTIEGLSL